MISDYDLLINKYISVPKSYSSFNPGALASGVVRGMLDSAGFPARWACMHFHVKDICMHCNWHARPGGLPSKVRRAVRCQPAVALRATTCKGGDGRFCLEVHAHDMMIMV